MLAARGFRRLAAAALLARRSASAVAALPAAGAALFHDYDAAVTECVERRALREGRKVHARMVVAGYRPAVYLATRLLIMYARCGALEDARNVLDGMPDRNVVSWTAMISGYSQNERSAEAMELFIKMLRAGCEPKEFTLVSTYLFDVVNSSHTFATGGTSTMEHWHDPKRLVDEIKISSNEETCATYNFLKVSRNLFRWTKEAKYADHYERLLINGIMGNQRGTQPGVMLYFLPMGPGRSKSVSGLSSSGLPPMNPGGWGGPNDTFWCCYGTGIESFSKLGDSIYFLEEGKTPGLYIIQYIPSTFDWKSAGLTIRQQDKPLFSTDTHFEVSLTISEKMQGDAQLAKVSVRIPSWTSKDGVMATLNGEKLDLTGSDNSSNGGFLTVTKLWAEDTLTLKFPITLRIEAIKDDRPEYASIQAVLFGPHLLAGLTHGTLPVTDSNHSNAGLTPVIWQVNATVSDWVTPLPSDSLNSQLVTLTQTAGSGERRTRVLSVSVADGRLAMAAQPVAGTDACAHATFRFYGGAEGTNVTVEPFDRPGMAVTGDLAVGWLDGGGAQDTVFHVVPGLDGALESVSLELGSRPGCFVAAEAGEDAGRVGVGCLGNGGGGGAEFRRAASFVRAAPMRRYHAMSFAARGMERGFLLEPLRSLQDEFYTVYFSLVSGDADG